MVPGVQLNKCADQQTQLITYDSLAINGFFVPLICNYSCGRLEKRVLGKDMMKCIMSVTLSVCVSYESLLYTI